MFLQCRKRGLVNRRRVNQPFGPKKNRGLPILPMSYQLSQSYYRYSTRVSTHLLSSLQQKVYQLQYVDRSFSTRFPHSLFTDSFRFLKTLTNSRTDDRRPTIQFYTESANRLENGEETVDTSKESEKSKKQNVSKGSSRAEGELETTDNESAEEEEKQNQEKNPEGRLAPDSAEAPLTTELEDDRLARAASSNAAAQAPEEPPDVSDMLRFSLDSPGGTCVASLSLISLGMLNVHISIPKHIVVVDSNLVDTDTVKR